MLTPEQIKTLATAQVIPHDTPPAVVSVFAEACKQHGLSPFKKEIYLVKYSSSNGPTYATIVGIDGLRGKAARTGQFAGRDDAKYNLKSDGSFMTAAEVKAKNELPVTCTVTIYRMIGGQRCAFTKTVLFSEYYPAVEAAARMGKAAYSKSATMPFNMIEKCAEAACLRMAFSAEVGGLHIEEEAAAFEDTTMQAVEARKGTPVDIEALKDQLQQTFTAEALLALYQSNPGHAEHAQLFSDRKQEIAGMIANGQIQNQ